MNFLLDIPIFKAYCDRQYLTDGRNHDREMVYVFALTLLGSRPLLFTVHTELGAVYSRLPIEALATVPKPKQNSVDKWGAISGNGTVIQHSYLKDYWVEIPKYKTCGRYHCTIDFYNGGFAQDPEQHKTVNIIFGRDGEIYALPNDELLFTDHHFTHKGKLTYRRNSKYYL